VVAFRQMKLMKRTAQTKKRFQTFLSRNYKHHKLIVLGVYLTLILLIFASAYQAYSVVFYRSPVKLTGLRQPPLKTLAANHNIEIGNFAIPSRTNEASYDYLLTSQFDLALVDNQPNWHFTDVDLRPSPTTYNFSRIDQVVNYATAHNMAIQMHHFIWGDEKWLPDWLKNGDYSKEQLLNIIHDHISVVGGRYSGKVKEWSVVNEAFSRAQHLYGLHDWWADHIGDQSYIDDSFIWARKADPHAKLLLNDFNDEIYSTTSNNMYNYIKSAKERGVPIDGIGMQMHIDAAKRPNKNEVVSNMQRFGKLGVKVYVTELDVNMGSVIGSSDYKNQLQAAIYYDMVRACIESKVCPSFSILGITDKETWYNYIGSNNANPLPFDRNYNPKPAYYSIYDALNQP
jgi:endo-1,4-beta-xylanase